jgi:hypothetical protein
MFSKKEILLFVVGLVLAIALTVSGTLYVFKYYLVLHDPRILLSNRAGSGPRKRSSGKSGGETAETLNYKSAIVAGNPDGRLAMRFPPRNAFAQIDPPAP